MNLCPNCGAEISDEARFCRKCGTRIDREGPEEIREDPVFEEPVDIEDGSVEFNWDQPVETHMSGDSRDKYDGSGSEAGGEEAKNSQETEEPEEGTYEWGAPLGDEEGSSDQSMMPVQFRGGDESEVIPDWDHTHEFDSEDISENKVMAMAAYVMGPLGIIIALLAAQNSPYAGFHVRQGLRFLILESLISIVMVLLCWTIIVPVVGGIAIVILLVIKVITFISVCKGKAIEAPLLRNIGFLK